MQSVPSEVREMCCRKITWRERERERERQTSGNITCINVIKFSLKMMHAIGTALPVKSVDSVNFQCYSLWGVLFLNFYFLFFIWGSPRICVNIPALRTVKWELYRAQHARECRRFIGLFINCKKWSYKHLSNYCFRAVGDVRRK